MCEPLDTGAARLGEILLRRGLKLAAAESCTGGWVAKVLTDIPGSSAWFDRGFVTYSNAAKQEMLGVSAEIIERAGAVSEAVVLEMAAGALQHSRAQVAVAISGVAGPGGGSKDKPVGTVWFAWVWPGESARTRRCRFAGDRDAVRRQSVGVAIGCLLDVLAPPSAESSR